MGKLAVVLFAALAFQAVLGGVPRFGHTQHEPKDFVSKFEITDSVYEPVQKTQYPGFPTSKKYYEQPQGHYNTEHDLKKWGITKNYFNKNYKTLSYGSNKYFNKYDDEHYGTFAKYSNKFGKKLNYIPVEQHEQKTEYTKYSKPTYGYKQVFDIEYEPEHTHTTSFSRYPEYYNEQYTQHSKYPYSYNKVHGGDYEPEYENSYSNKYSKVFDSEHIF